MEKPVLVLLAAGMGSRYGGLKQIDPVDEAGNVIIDFSIYDALRAGFEDMVFIIKEEIREDFMDVIGRRMSQRAGVACAFQELCMLPDGVKAPQGRVKPYGTTHALLCAREAIGGRPFAVINSDDYYGPAAFRLLYGFLSAGGDPHEHMMVGYSLENTLTEYGSVARGICEEDSSGCLAHIVERRKIFRDGDGGKFTLDDVNFHHIPAGTPVSMNCWGFRPSIFPYIEREFNSSIAAGLEGDPLKYEDLLPNAIQSVMAAGGARVRMHRSPDRWFGVTYREDKPKVVESIARLKAQGVYSERLW